MNVSASALLVKGRLKKSEPIAQWGRGPKGISHREDWVTQCVFGLSFFLI